VIAGYILHKEASTCTICFLACDLLGHECQGTDPAVLRAIPLRRDDLLRAGVLPKGVGGMHAEFLDGPFMLQV